MCERPLVITLEDPIHVPEYTKVFRARERRTDDLFTQFVGSNTTADVLHVHNDNIRAIADTTGSETIEAEAIR